MCRKKLLTTVLHDVLLAIFAANMSSLQSSKFKYISSKKTDSSQNFVVGNAVIQAIDDFCTWSSISILIIVIIF